MKYAVTIPYICFVTVEVDADDKDEAEEIALDKSYLEGYVGNGGHNKLVGVDDTEMSVEPGDIDWDTNVIVEAL